MSKLFTRNDYTLGIRCPKLLWRYRHGEVASSEFAEWRFSKLSDMTAVRKYCSSIKECTYIDCEDVYMAAAKTADAVNSGAAVIGRGAVIAHPLSCRFDLLRRRGDGSYILSVIRAGTHLRQITCHDAAYQIFVLAAAGIRVSAVDFVRLNPDWTEENKKSLFAEERITGRVFSQVGGVKTKLEKFLHIVSEKNETRLDIHNGCFVPSECELWHKCTADLPENNVFDIGGVSRQTKLKLYRAGKTGLSDAADSNLLTPAQKKQINDALYKDEPFVDREKTSEFLKTLYFPLCFLDFESMQLPLPPFDGVHPFEAVAFQYSLHILYSPGDSPVHKSCIVLPGTDPRRIIAEQLVKDIPRGACVAAYNTQLEKQVTESLAKRFPDLEKRLMEINSNTVDMMYPFLKKYYYAPQMNGSFSLKKVLRALYPDDEALDYNKLCGVHNGKEAAVAYAMITAGAKDYDVNEVLSELDAYCTLDTLALVKLYEKLCKAVEIDDAVTV